MTTTRLRPRSICPSRALLLLLACARQGGAHPRPLGRSHCRGLRARRRAPPSAPPGQLHMLLSSFDSFIEWSLWLVPLASCWDLDSLLGPFCSMGSRYLPGGLALRYTLCHIAQICRLVLILSALVSFSARVSRPAATVLVFRVCIILLFSVLCPDQQ